jgi:hypothetical protein
MNEAPPRSCTASIDAFTASAVSVSPSWNVTPSRRWKVHVSLSELDSQLSARTPWNSSAEPSGFFRSRPS